jgi:hypothetical protein
LEWKLTPEFFAQQMSRLKTRFGEKAFDPETQRLIGLEVNDVPSDVLMRCVDSFISSRPHTKPPLVTDFREARLNFKKNEFNRDVDGAVNAMKVPWQNGLQKFLAENYPGCKTLNEAVEIERLRIRVKNALGE